MASGEYTGPKEVLEEFLWESRENIDQLETGLLRLETEPLSSALLIGLFRNLHTVKGTCGFLGFSALEKLAHAGEDLLQLVREEKLTLDVERVAALLSVVDAARQSIQRIASTAAEGPEEHEELIARLRLLQQPGTTAPSPAASAPSPRVARKPVPPPEQADTKIRVDVALLDRLMNLVGELVLTRNQVLQCAASAADLTAPTHRLNLVTTELQEVVMKTRLQPIGNVWNRFPRLVRDLALGYGKQAQLLLHGEDTELDKTLLEALQEPLTHLLRNAIDHGLETPDRRVAVGKSPVGCLTLRAWHMGGMIHLELSDDGTGIDPQRLRQRAVELRLITAEQARRLSDAESLALIFLPGFSTAQQVTLLSGRGVGMDVVKADIQKIGGTVEVYSEPGKGTQVKLKIPLTLAIVPSLIVTCQGDRFAIPQASLLEVVQLDAELVRRDIHLLHETPVLKLRERLVPLAWLGRELGLSSTAPPLDEALSLVVLQVGERSFGLVVDAINDTEEIVVKPLWGVLKSIACYAGATVLGDGKVALILDAQGLGQRLGLMGEQREPDAGAQEQGSEAQEARERVLVCRNGPDGRLAIPLSRVSRLEEVPGTRVEHLGRMEVVQYRGRLLPLVRVASVLRERRRVPRTTARVPVLAGGELPIVVCSYGDAFVGLVVDGILDVVEVKVELQRHSRRACVLGSMVVQEHATEFLDVEAVIREALPTLPDTSPATLDRSA